MTNLERYQYFKSGQLHPLVQIALIDWMTYWTTAGLDDITDPVLNAQTVAAINLLIEDPDSITEKVAEFVIGEEVIKTAEEIPTESQIKTAVDSIMANKLRWITNMY